MSVHCSNKIQNSASQEEYEKFRQSKIKIPDSKVHGANMGSIWSRQDTWPYVVPMLDPWTLLSGMPFQQYSDSHHRDKSASLLIFLNAGNPYIWKYIGIETEAKLPRLSHDTDWPIYHVEDQEGDGKQYARKFVRAESFMTPLVVRGAVDTVFSPTDVFFHRYDNT